jgi:hypothetical protein
MVDERASLTNVLLGGRPGPQEAPRGPTSTAPRAAGVAQPGLYPGW